jgi:hypothetical protein
VLLVVAPLILLKCFDEDEEEEDEEDAEGAVPELVRKKQNFGSRNLGS